MGPYSEERQLQRAESIAALLVRGNLPETTRAMWEGHLRNLSRNEAQYNIRVVEIYKHMKSKGIIQWEE